MIQKSPQRLIDELYTVEGKAEIVNGEIVLMSPTGEMPGDAAYELAASLKRFVRSNSLPGKAFSDNYGFIVDLPNRKSFSPDAAYFIGERSGMKFLIGAPIFAIEVRSENDYGKAVDKRIAEKRDDYFAAGTQVVWDVDLLGKEIIHAYCAETSKEARVFLRGEIADAETVLPSWKFAVDDLFEDE